MSEQIKIAFENWYISEHCKDLSEISINEVMAKTSLGVYSSFHVNGAYSGWQAATAEANKRINALESEVAELRSWKNQAIELENEWDSQSVGKALNIQLGHSIRAGVLPKINELQLSHNRLREALEDTTERLNEIEKDSTLIAGDIKCIARNKKLLSATPAESLQAHDDEVIEKVYQVVENISDSSRTSVEILEAIRALKEVK